MKSSIKKTKVAVIGATGFTGEKLIDILLGHPKVDITYISAVLEKEDKFSNIFPSFKGRLDLICKNLKVEDAVKADLIFLALPHRISLEIAPYFLKKGKIVIDLSADYRFKDAKVYEKYYQVKHSDSKNLNKAVYGLPEFWRKDIKKAKLIANPGCYPTVSVLSIAPLLKEGLIKNIIVDAKSGITGAGRKGILAYHYAHLNGNMFSYKPFGHQHLPEIEQTLNTLSGKKAKLRFTPHLIPIERGILITVYADLTKKLASKEIAQIYEKYYKGETFVRLLGEKLPQLKDVVETNFCDIGFAVSEQQIVIVSTIDNLIKGASGQAVQNMNIIMGYKEEEGLL